MATVNSIELRVNLRANNNEKSDQFGRLYAELDRNRTLSLRGLAKHISEHGSIYTPDVVYGVLEKFRSCLLEMLLNSRKVKITGLGTFYLTAECQKGGADKEEDFNVNQHLKALHIRFLPDQAAEDNISSREFIKKAEFVNAEALAGQLLESESGGESYVIDQPSNGGAPTGGEAPGEGD